jgi:hypothetical protein
LPFFRGSSRRRNRSPVAVSIAEETRAYSGVILMHKVKNDKYLPVFASLAVMAATIAGCTSTGNYVTDWGEITLSPGDTGSCNSNPCRVYFRMPPGDGTYKVTGTGFTIGEYPAGKTAMIGSFFESSAIRVEGAGVPTTYIYVPGTASDVP